MAKKRNHKKYQENKPEYVPPQVMRLEDVHTGQGACESGTGGDGDCNDYGYSPTGGFCAPGISASFSCIAGNGFVGGCMEPGGEDAGGCMEPGGEDLGG